MHRDILKLGGIVGGGLVWLGLSGCKTCGDDGLANMQGNNPECLQVTEATTEATESGSTATAPTTTVSATESTGSPGKWCADKDGDGFGDPDDCQDQEFPGSVGNDGDCADNNPNAFPGAAEAEDMSACMEDADGDGWGDDMPPAGVTPGTDCNDDIPTIFPGAAGKEDPNACMQDSDGDGYGDGSPDDPDVPPGTDCADADPNTFPGAAENDSPTACMTDADDDGFGDDSPSSPDAEPGTDCDDGSAETFPGAAEAEDPDACMKDGDNDGHGDASPPDGVTPGDDCLDGDPNTFPGAAELDSPTECMTDADDDGYGDDTPEPGVTPGVDCLDDDPDAFTNCGPCVPDASACVSDELHVCNPAGTGEKVTSCGGGCDPDTKVCLQAVVVDAGGSVCVDPGVPAQLDAMVTGGDGVYTYAWTPATGLDDPGKQNPQASVTEPTTYTVEVLDGKGNQGSDKVTVYIKDQILTLDPNLCSTFEFPWDNDIPTLWSWNDQTKELCQTTNGRSSALFCGWELSNATIEGTFAAKDLTDDDWLGFLWGLQDTDHFYIFTWKKSPQNVVSCGGILPQGMMVKVVDVADPMAKPQNCADLHLEANTANSRVLVHPKDFLTDGWQGNTTYTFSLTHKQDGEMTIVVKEKDTNTVVAMTTFTDPTYDSGKFGMYTKSQENACFSQYTATCAQ